MPTAVNDITSTTQQYLDIYDVSNDILILKDGSTALILTVSAMNFGLLAEQEQDAIMYAYAGLLNSLNYPIQIVIRSQTKDVTSYLHLLEDEENNSHSSSRKNWISRYRQFVGELIKERNVLDKKFYVAIPATSLEMGLLPASSVLPGSGQIDISKIERSVILEKAREILEPKRDYLISQFGRIGLQSRQLTTQEIIQFFYLSYNPEAAEGQQITDTNSYTTPLVQASMQGGIMMDNVSSPQNQNNQADTTQQGQSQQTQWQAQQQNTQNDGAQNQVEETTSPEGINPQDVIAPANATVPSEEAAAQTSTPPQPAQPSEQTPVQSNQPQQQAQPDQLLQQPQPMPGVQPQTGQPNTVAPNQAVQPNTANLAQTSPSQPQLADQNSTTSASTQTAANQNINQAGLESQPQNEADIQNEIDSTLKELNSGGGTPMPGVQPQTGQPNTVAQNQAGAPQPVANQGTPITQEGSPDINVGTTPIPQQQPVSVTQEATQENAPMTLPSDSPAGTSAQQDQPEAASQPTTLQQNDQNQKPPQPLPEI